MPLDERTAELSFTLGEIPAGMTPLLNRVDSPIVRNRDRLAELIAVPAITPLLVLISLVVAGCHFESNTVL